MASGSCTEAGLAPSWQPPHVKYADLLVGASAAPRTPSTGAHLLLAPAPTATGTPPRPTSVASWPTAPSLPPSTDRARAAGGGGVGEGPSPRPPGFPLWSRMVHHPFKIKHLPSGRPGRSSDLGPYWGPSVSPPRSSRCAAVYLQTGISGAPNRPVRTGCKPVQ